MVILYSMKVKPKIYLKLSEKNNRPLPKNMKKNGSGNIFGSSEYESWTKTKNGG